MKNYLVICCQNEASKGHENEVKLKASFNSNNVFATTVNSHFVCAEVVYVNGILIIS